MLKLQENPVGHSWTSDFHQLIQVGSQFKDTSRGLPNGVGGQILGSSARPENLRGRKTAQMSIQCSKYHKACWCWRSLIMNHRNIDCNVNSMLNVKIHVDVEGFSPQKPKPDELRFEFTTLSSSLQLEACKLPILPSGGCTPITISFCRGCGPGLQFF